MLKILFVLILILSNSYSYVVYVPCEYTIGLANIQLETKIKTITTEINSKTSIIKNKYNKYNTKLEDYNKMVQTSQLLQSEKNKLLLDIKNQLTLIKSEVYLGDDIEKNK